jgi:anti-anti-sigma factor
MKVGRAQFSLTTHQRDGTLIVTLAGELDMVGAEDVRAFIEHMLKRGAGPIEIDAQGVTFIDSVGVRSLLHLVQRCKELAIKISFAMSEDVRRVLDVLGLGSLENVTSTGPLGD